LDSCFACDSLLGGAAEEKNPLLRSVIRGFEDFAIWYTLGVAAHGLGQAAVPVPRLMSA